MDLSNPYVLALFVVVALVMMVLTLRSRNRSDGGGTHVGVLGRLFLVLLRVAIGWHFLVEGLDKYSNPGWSSEPYLREATGPLAPKFRQIAGDRVLDELTLGEGKAFPAALHEEWQRYLDAFAGHYSLDEKQQQEAKRTLDQSESKMKTWMLAPQPVTKPSLLEPKLTVDWDMPQRVAHYRELRAKADQLEAELPQRFRDAKLFAHEKSKNEPLSKADTLKAEKAWKDVVWKDWLDAKAAATKYRAELKKDLDGQTKEFKDALKKLLTADQQELSVLVAVIVLHQLPPILLLETKEFKDALKKLLTADQQKKAPLQEPIPRPFDMDHQLDVSDNVVKYGLIASGICLIVGAFTPLAALFGAGLLLMFYLAMPALPYLPEGPRSEGHYLYVNKNIIEALALLSLAFLPTGRWAGLDGLLQFLNPLNWRRPRRAGIVVGERRLETIARR